jgi:hypothetical protein
MPNKRIVHCFRGALLAAALLSAAGSAFAQYSAPIHDVDNPARQPFKSFVTGVPVNQNTTVDQDLVTVPANKRLVLEYVNVRCAPATPTTVQLIEFINPISEAGAITIPLSNLNLGLFTSLVSYSVDPGHKLTLQVITPNQGGPTFCDALVSGHYVNLP